MRNRFVCDVNCIVESMFLFIGLIPLIVSLLVPRTFPYLKKLQNYEKPHQNRRNSLKYIRGYKRESLWVAGTLHSY